MKRKKKVNNKTARKGVSTKPYLVNIESGAVGRAMRKKER